MERQRIIHIVMVGLLQSSLSVTVQTVSLDQFYSADLFLTVIPDSKELWSHCLRPWLMWPERCWRKSCANWWRCEMCETPCETVWNAYRKYAQCDHLMGVSCCFHQGNFEQKCDGYPIPILASLGWEQWLLCWSGWWLGDAMHFCYGCECLTVKS